jgi:hypothetical protein
MTLTVTTLPLHQHRREVMTMTNENAPASVADFGGKLQRGRGNPT